ncbi:Citrate transporter [Coriobacterium glomerans PW2]|uniref:Citrate transporter n=2 Tax=Coriobacterium TaxID=33870 RepID=F2N8R5_CORGP|nr:Citrate transporter [Coriobacterium glomerans PW2]
MNTCLAVLGFATMIIVTIVLLKKWVSTLLAFTTIPLIAGIIALVISGGNPLSIEGVSSIGAWIKTGIGMTSDITLMMLFSLPYFMLMADTGLFDDIVKAIMKRVPISAPVVCVLTVVVACIIELDGSITSVFLITVPLMLPLYERFKVDKRVLPFAIAIAILFMCNTPWNPKILRAATLIPDVANASTAIFLKLVPIQIFMFVLLVGITAFIGIRARKHQLEEIAISHEDLLDQFQDTELTRHNLFWVNLLLTALMIFCLIAFQSVPQYYVFALGLVIALAINFRDLGQQSKLLKKYAAELFPVAPAVLLSGVVVGVMQESGMLDAMVNAMMGVVPPALGPWLYIIVALFSTPLMLLFTNDTWFYALMPLVSAFSIQYGVPAETVIVTLFMNFGSMISVIAQPQLYIATDLTGITIDQHIRFTFFKLWAINIAVVIFGVVTGIFMP